jgi:hypothetical protein
MNRRCWSASALSLLLGLVACGGPTSQELVPEPFGHAEQEARSHEGATGALRWAHHITGQAPVLDEYPPEKSATLALDGQNHILALYSFTGRLDLGPRSVMAPGGPSSTAIALARYDDRGRLEWVKLFGPGAGLEGGIFGRHIAVDRRHDILLVVGATNVDLGDGELSSGEYLVKLDRHGRLRWKRSLSFPELTLAVFKVVTDRDNHLAIAGFFQGTVDFGRGPVSSQPDPAGGFGPSAFLAKFTPEGEHEWTYVHPRFYSAGLAATVDSKNHFLLAGDIYTPGAPQSSFLVRLTPDGHLLWERYLQPTYFTTVRDVATHGNRVVLVGTFDGRLTFGGQTLTADRQGFSFGDAFLAAFTRDGEERWARSFGFAGDLVGMDQRDGVVVVGTYRAGDDLGLGPVAGKSEVSSNLFLARYDRIHGELIWVRGFPAGLAEPSALAVTKSGRSFLIGSFRSGSLIVGSQEWPQRSPNDLFLFGLER